MLALWLNSGIRANKTMDLGRITDSSNIPQLYSLGSSVSVASWCEFVAPWYFYIWIPKWLWL